MRSINVEFSNTAGTRALLIDRDTALVGVNWFAGSAVISSEPTLTYDQATTISADRIGDEFRVISYSAGLITGLDFPLSEGQVIFVAPGSGVLSSSLQLFFNP